MNKEPGGNPDTLVTERHARVVERPAYALLGNFVPENKRIRVGGPTIYGAPLGREKEVREFLGSRIARGKNRRPGSIMRRPAERPVLRVQER